MVVLVRQVPNLWELSDQKMDIEKLPEGLFMGQVRSISAESHVPE
jgi:hypothetical protein